MRHGNQSMRHGRVVPVTANKNMIYLVFYMRSAEGWHANLASGVKAFADDRGAKLAPCLLRTVHNGPFSIGATVFAGSERPLRKIFHFCICHLAHIRAMCDCLAPNY
jgi:hypothetical protein